MTRGPDRAAPQSAPTHSAGKLLATPAMKQRAAIVAIWAPPQPVPAPVPVPLTAEAIAAARRKRRRQEFRRTRKLLRGRWPKVFSRPRPLAIGIFHSLRDQLAGDVSVTALRRFLTRWTRRRAYQTALRRGDRRIDLAGGDAGPAFKVDLPVRPARC